MLYLIWSLVLILQNFSFVLVSRARNSNNIWYHCICSLFSNGVWFAQNFILVGNVIDIIHNSDWHHAVLIGLFYTTFTMIGAITAHWFAMHLIEKKIK